MYEKSLSVRREARRCESLQRGGGVSIRRDAQTQLGMVLHSLLGALCWGWGLEQTTPGVCANLGCLLILACAPGPHSPVPVCRGGHGLYFSFLVLELQL